MISRTNKMPYRTTVLRTPSQLRRGEYFGALFILGCVNGFASRSIESIERLGWATALFNTFEVSAIIWVSGIAGIILIFRDRTPGVNSLDLCLGAVFVLFVILPIGPLSWIAVTGLSLYILFSTEIGTSRRGALILLATTVPMLWSRMLFQFFAGQILQIDALLVSWILGTHRSGTLVEFADRSGQLVILPSCSSIANVSLAFLCWVTFTQLVQHKKSPYDIFWCFLACAAVIVSNVSRITFLGLSRWHYATFHNQWGDAVANIIMLVLIVGICALGVGRERLQRT